MYPADLKYTNEHEWVKLEGNVATIGITAHAAEELGEIVYIELPEVGTKYAQMEEAGSVESVKTVSTMYLPIGGTVTEVNSDLADTPELLNSSPYEKGWIAKLEVEDKSEVEKLLSDVQYKELLETA